MPAPPLKKSTYEFAPKKIARAPRGHIFRAWIKKIIITIIGVGTLIGIVGFFTVVQGLPDPKDLFAHTSSQSTKMYARDGTTLLYEIFTDARRTKVSLNALPRYIIDATVAAEDREFWIHRGLSLRGMIRAVLIDLRKGRAAAGGSTITQQLVKNAILTRERTLQRKARELVLAWRIEQTLSKEEILELYLNEIPYGGAAYGIEAASQMYFGKHATELNLPEAAMIAGIAKAPSFYSPWGQNKDKLQARTDYILDAMAALGTATESDITAAKELHIVANIKPKRESIRAPHFSLWVRDQLIARYGERMVERGGLSVTTTLDWPIQEAAEKAVREVGAENAKKFNATNAAAVAIDPVDGAIRAMVGSRDYFNSEIDGQVNVTTRLRQPGSSIKPFVYATGFLHGFTPETVLEDIKVTFLDPPKPYTPENYDDKERGFVTVREALAMSLNIPAVKMLALVGVDTVIDLTEKFGYTSFRDRSRFGLSFTLGGAEVTLLEHTAAYAALAAEGTYHAPYDVIRVTDAKGSVLEETIPGPGERVLDLEVVRQLTDILSDNTARAPIFGIHNNLTLPDRPVAAKTGTTQDYRDSWVMGYTPQLAVGVWGGNNDNTPMKGRASGLYVSAPIWNRIMIAGHKKQPTVAFTSPAPRTPTGKPVLDGVKGGAALKIDRISGKLATAATPAHLIQEKIFTNPHTILYYVNPENPRGLPPPNPEIHPYFQIWEDAVTTWARKHNLTADAPPTEYDNVHTPEAQPSLIVTSPLDDATVSGDRLQIMVDVSAPRGVARIDYLLDNELLASVAAPPFHLDIPIPTFITAGRHTITVRVLDDVENAAERTFRINFPHERSLTNILLAPAANQTIRPWEFPYIIRVALADTSVTSIRVYLKPEGGAERVISTVIQPVAANKILWTNRPEPGTYELIIETAGPNGTARLPPARIIVQ